MANTTFVTNVTPIASAWCQDINNVTYNILGNGTTVPTTAQQLLTNLGIYTAIWSAIGNGTTPPSTPSDVRTNLGLTATSGSNLVGFIQGSTGSVSQTVQSQLRSTGVTPQNFGAVGDGITDDSTAFTAMFATGLPWYIPYTANGYLLSVTQTINADGVCDGFFVPTTAIGSGVHDYDRFLFIIAPASYPTKRYIRGLKVAGNTTVRAANVSGIRVDCANATLDECTAYQLNYGIVVRMYSVTLRRCSAFQCNTNMSGYARDSSHEINALCIDSGNYDSGVNVAINLGDTSWSDALAAGNMHGVDITITNSCNTDGAVSKLDNVGAVNITGIYTEGTNTDCLWQLGGSGDGNIRGVRVVGNFFKTASYAVKCLSGVDSLEVGPNFLSAISSCEVKMSSDIYGLVHKKGTYAGCFGSGQPVGLAFRSLPITSIQFSNITIESDFLKLGTQDSVAALTKYYPSGAYRTASSTSRNTSSSVCAFYTSPATGKAGTVASNVFTFTTKSDCYAFNGGDRIATSPAGATYVRSVDYVNGTALLDGGTTANGAATISQQTVLLHTDTITYNGSPPASGTFAQGDHCINGIVTVGSPQGWFCTVAGTPGTWVSEGNL